MISSRVVRSISHHHPRLFRCHYSSRLASSSRFRASASRYATNPLYRRITSVSRNYSVQSSSCRVEWDKASFATNATFFMALFCAGATCWTNNCACDEHAPSFVVKQKYNVVKLLGEGSYGRVFLARRKSDGLPVALKAIDREAISQDEFRNEVTALEKLSENGGHPHVCRLYDLHDDGSKFYYLELELISGGELFEHLIDHGPYSEAQAAVFLCQFAEAIFFMHSNGVVHADLKPENLMMSTEDDDGAQLKIVDFGCAVVKNARDSAKSEKKRQFGESDEILGTIAYWSPELVERKSRPSEASDMWAIGCILFILVTGIHPFDPMGLATDDEVVNNIRMAKDGDFIVFDERVEGLSDSCISLMKSLLQADPTQRMTSDGFLRHPWVQGLTASWETMENSARKLETYWQRRFRAEVIRKYAKATSETRSSLSDENLRDIFRSMDLDGNGTLEPAEIRVALRGLGVKDKDVSEIIKSIDLDGSGNVAFDEFCTIMRRQFDNGPGVKVSFRQQRFRTQLLQKFTGSSTDDTLPSEQKLKEIFHAIDLDGNGVLDPHEIRVVLRSVGVPEREISQIIASCDLDRSGGVDWEEFSQLMNKQLST